jgi:hypothetical protein
MRSSSWGRGWGARGQQRQQLKWFALVAVLVLAEVAVTGLVPREQYPLALTVGFAILNWGIYAAIDIAVLRYHLYDIDRLLNRTVVYGLLTAILVTGYMVSVLSQLSRAGPIQSGRRGCHPGHGRRVPTRSATACKTRSTAASTGIATARPGPWRRSPVSAPRSTWTRCTRSCWPLGTKPWSQQPYRSGCDQRNLHERESIVET